MREKERFLELLRKAEQSKYTFKKWTKSVNSTTAASFVAAQEIVRRGKPFTDANMGKTQIGLHSSVLNIFQNRPTHASVFCSSNKMLTVFFIVVL